MQPLFYNAHHSPAGAFASFTLGCKGASGGFGLEAGAPAGQSVYIGLQSRLGDCFEALPFYHGAEAAQEAERYLGDAESGEGIEEAKRDRIPLNAFADSVLQRRLGAGTDVWQAPDMSFALYTPVPCLPDPRDASEAELRHALLPAILAELVVDNRGCSRERIAFAGFGGDPQGLGMRRIEDSGYDLKGVGQGLWSAMATRHDGAEGALGFTLEDLLNAFPSQNRAFGIGSTGAVLFTVPPGEICTFRMAFCFYREGIVTANLPARYLYTKYFGNIEEAAEYALQHFDSLKQQAEEADANFAPAHLSDDQKWMLAHALHAYYGSTQLLEHEAKPLWVVNEGEYRMMNTLDLTVDHLFFEMKQNPWVVRNALDLWAERYSYHDQVSACGDAAMHPGGISFTHDMGVANIFSRPGHSSYEQSGKKGCFSHMTCEQLVNWICCATVYCAASGDTAWRDSRLGLLQECLQSLLNRDHPEPARRTGMMQMESSRTAGGAEITTYDSLNESLGQARANAYLTLKIWAACVALEKLFRSAGHIEAAGQAAEQAVRSAGALGRCIQPDGSLPAILEGETPARIIPAIEGLIFPLFAGCPEALDAGGKFGVLIRQLGAHLDSILKPGICLFPDGGWKLSSTARNSWLSKIYLCQFIARHILGRSVSADADRAHVNWLLDKRNIYWGWSDQILDGVVCGSRYYPRGVTAVLWLLEKENAR